MRLKEAPQNQTLIDKTNTLQNVLPLKPNTPKISVKILKTDKPEQRRESRKTKNSTSNSNTNKEKCQEKIVLKEKISRELQITLFQLTRMMDRVQRDEYKILFEKWLGDGGIANILNLCLVEDRAVWRQATAFDKDKK